MSKKLIQAAAGAGGESVYVDDVFSTYLYTGNDTTQTVTTGLDIANEGGLIWQKPRVSDTYNNDHKLFDTERGQNKVIYTNNNAVEDSGRPLSYTSTGFTLDTSSKFYGLNENNKDYVTWNFVKQAGFFDVVTYTGTGSNPHTVSHNLGSVPGFIVVKATSSTGNWCVAAYDGTNYRQLSLNTSDQSFASASVSNIATSTTIDVGYMGVNFDGSANASGVSYVAYLFAHDDQSFGDNSDESIIKCGSYTGNGGTQEINLGWEAQFVIIKSSSNADNWDMFDVMRGMTVGGNDESLDANRSNPATTDTDFLEPYANGFRLTSGNVATNYSSRTYIYIAIRRPMKTPESGTDVFTPNAYTGNGATRVLTSSNDPVDLGIVRGRGGSADWIWSDRLRGATKTLYSNYTQAEDTQSTYITGFDVQDGMEVGTGTAVNGSGSTYISYMLSRATGFFDVVAYTGDGTFGGKNHNLGVVPELIINKGRNSTQDWSVWLPNSASPGYGFLRQTLAFTNLNIAATSTTFDPVWDTSSNTYIAYLFATLAGVSKVGSYSGTGSNVDVDCGFSAGARFVLIKRTDSTGDWYVYDSKRGIVAGNDPYILLNSTAAEVTTTDYIDPLSSGFTVTSSAPAALNSSGGTYIFLAIA